MSKKTFVLVVGLLVILMTAGCFDLFDVPGVAVSPDGSQVYFLSGTLGSSADKSTGSSLSSVSINGGDPTVIKAGDKDNLVSAFAVNPTNGDVAYVYTSKADGPHLILSSGGNTRELAGKSVLGNLAVGTMMQYSPDGSKFALSVVQFPPEITADMLENSSDLKPEQLAGAHFVLYLVNPSDGSTTAISDTDKERANTLAWNPSGKLLAYNAWVDTNGDGSISTMPNFTALQPGGASSGASGTPDLGDSSQIYIYDVGAGKGTAVTTSGLNFAPVFISETEVAYVALDLTGMMGGSQPSVMAYDASSGASRSVYQGKGLPLGLAVSPDRQQIAWVESSQSGAAAGAGGGSSPSELMVSGPNFANPTKVAELPSVFGLPDVPVFTPDGKSLLISSTSIFSSIMGQFGGASGSSATKAPEEQSIVRIDIASGSSTDVYKGAMMNSSMFSSLIGLMGSGMMNQLGASGKPGG